MQLDYSVLLDKTFGCWIGKTIAGVIGAPFEAHKFWGEFTQNDDLWPKELYANDDLDIQLIFLEMMEECGPKVTYENLVKYWQDRCWYNFCEYGSLLNNEQRGIHAPMSGEFNNSYWMEDQGCPIRAEVFGVTAPCNPELAAEHGRIDGTQDHINESVYAEMFWAACTARAYVSSDLEDIFNVAREIIPSDCDIYRISYEVKELCESGKSLKSIWRELVRRWGDEDFSDARINFAFAMLPLYYSKLDIKEAMLCSVNLSWDTDCTSGIACALVGTILGAKGLPQDWVKRVGDLITCDVDSKYNGKTILEFSKSCCAVAIESTKSINTMLEITNVPKDVEEFVEKQIKSRASEPKIEISSVYNRDEFVIYPDSAGEVYVKLTNNTDKPIKGVLMVKSDRSVSPSLSEIIVPENGHIFNLLTVDKNSDILWSKNLVYLTFETEDKEIFSHTTGCPGANVWKVYGPYWDQWDKSKYDVCPYRNDERIKHPGAVEESDCTWAMFHQFISLDSKYFDEERLLKEDILDEEPYDIECDEDIITSKELDLRMNECLVYFTRDIVFDKDTSCDIFIGGNAPFILYVDGKEVARNDKYYTYSPHDILVKNLEFGLAPKRLVIKALKPHSDFKLGLQFMLSDWAGDKKRGISYILDNYGTKLS